MSSLQLYSKINSLPKELKKEVENFITRLSNKSPEKKKIKERKFGYAKNFFTIAPDFEEPLDDFKDYQ